jgi:hypothetical protein
MSHENHVEKVFRDTLAPNGKSQENSYQTMISKIFYSSIGWAIIVFFVVSIMLFMLNPPIVQNKKSENDLSKQRPDVFIIAIFSGISAIAVFLSSKFVQVPSFFT